MDVKQIERRNHTPVLRFFASTSAAGFRWSPLTMLLLAIKNAFFAGAGAALSSLSAFSACLTEAVSLVSTTQQPKPSPSANAGTMPIWKSAQAWDLSPH